MLPQLEVLRSSTTFLVYKRVKGFLFYIFTVLKYWKKRILLVGFTIFIIWYINCLPSVLFNCPYSTVLFDGNGNLLGAKIAKDGQWRFKAEKTIPEKMEKCLIEFEDRNFYKHYGISAKGIGRAIYQNIKSKKVVSGGSTLTMQVARMMRKNPPRTVAEKIIEMIIATRLEIRYSKKELLKNYLANAPFGNNVVGMEAAAWRYFGRKPEQLSWAESAMLAVLPNAPGLIYPGRNHQRLLEKRNRLLKRLFEAKQFDKTTYNLSLQEPLPNKPLPLPQFAPHLLNKFIKDGYEGKTIYSSIDYNLQLKAIELINAHSLILQQNKIYNGALLITSVKTGKILAYVGNTNLIDAEQGCAVDCIQAARSTGSILKPFLFEKCLEDGLITPTTLLPDIPTQYGSFSPKNFTKQYDGAIPANKALARSLNIPMVRLLNEYGLEKFHRELKLMGLTTLKRNAKHYGLSLILGGAEAKLWDLNLAYTQMAQQLKYNATKKITFLKDETDKKTKTQVIKMDEGCIYATFEAMVDANRPDEDGNWRAFSSQQKIAWKTGTSFGYRDAWAIGVTPDYVVSIWVGNADGEGRPGLTGLNAAAPLLFDVFSKLPTTVNWFTKPTDELEKVAICRESGHRASSLCNNSDMMQIPKPCLNTIACPYHQLVHLNVSRTHRVDSECETIFNMRHEAWFVLPPLIEKYYKFNHPNYKELPSYKLECMVKLADKAMALLYPKPNSKIYVPIEIDGKIGRTIFEATHRNLNSSIYWHLDDAYIGETKEIHQLALNPSVGKHKLLLVDENGISIQLKFEILGKDLGL